MLKQCSDHAHIVKLLDYFASDTCVYLAMELVEGGNLQDRLDSDGPYADADGARIFTQVCGPRACPGLPLPPPPPP